MSKEVAIVIGSGFGGSVVALRLAEAFEAEIKSGGLRVIVLERGRRYAGDDFPRLGLPGEWTVNPELQTSKPLPDVARFSWQNDLGLWELRNLRGLQVAQAAGLGGGSLIYAAVHLRAPHSVFEAWPEPYHGGALDAHYRKVEDTLKLQTAPADRWPKTKRMRRVAKTLHREADFFRPPLAINFTETEQAPACSGCGHCTIGCPSGAKNTLDRNYLARAEALGVEIRTLCEVVEIAALDAERYRVSFRDHAFGGSIEAEDAQHVFVCAGALNSTELLMRSRERLLAPEVGRAEKEQGEAEKALGALGAPFFANGDALGVVFDAERQWQPTEGPTITSSLYVGPARGKGASGKGDSWFLIQEGGMPWSLAPALNLLRSPLWLGRNQLVGRGIEAEQSALYTPQVRARGDFLAGLPGMLYRDGARRDRASAASDVSVADDPAASLLLETLPTPARDQAETLLGLKSLVERHLLRVVDKVVARVDDERPGLSFFRWLARLDRDRLNALTKEVLEATYPAARVLLQSRSPWEMLAAGLRSAWRLDAPLENTVVLLAMGADEALELREVGRPRRHRSSVGARRRIDSLFGEKFFLERDTRGEREDRELNCRTSGRGPQPPLRLEVVPARNRRAQARRQSIYRRQERLMSDIARATGGELRTNPSWTIGRQPVTVHAQGGCAMGKVTDVDGKVNGLANLYVMDGSVFPSSVGVNPSHTIAAVAERNIAQFIALRRSRRRAPQGEARVPSAPPPPAPTAAVPAEASQVVQIEASKHDRPAIRTGPTKLVWRERLKGFFVAAPAFGPERVRAAQGVVSERELFDLNASVDVFHECERRGALAGQRMELAVTATVPDLEALIDGRSSMVDLSDGTLTLVEAGRSTPFKGVTGKLELQLGGTAVSPLARRKATLRTGGMVYRLKDAAGSLHMYGFKQLTDDPGLDAWLDLTTLYVDLALETGVIRGVLRVSIPDFLRDQLPSFAIDKPGLAPEQQLWALGQFARFFLGRVGRIYMPEWL